MDYKTCLSGDECLHPNGPELPVNEFYKYRGQYHSYCKHCRRHYEKTHRKPLTKTRKESGHKGEDILVNKLNSLGIYTTTGRLSPFRHVDVVAWGCVRIEVKTSKYNARESGWGFNFYPQRNVGIKADLVCLIPFCEIDKTPLMFSLFYPTHESFYKPNGVLKYRVQLLKNALHRKSTGTPLTMHNMYEHEERWDLIEDVRLRIAQEIANGTYDPGRVNAPHTPPSLFAHG